MRDEVPTRSPDLSGSSLDRAEHLVDRDSQVVADELTQNLVDLRRRRFQSHILPQLELER